MISELDPADLDAVRALRRALHDHHAAMPTPAGFAVRDADDAWAAWRTAVVSALENGTDAVLVHRDAHGALDGMAYVRVLGEASQRRPVLEPAGRHGELVTLSVAPHARGAGVGAELNDAAAQWCRTRGLAAMHVVVRSDNEGALRFYRRRGAVPTWETLLMPLAQPIV